MKTRCRRALLALPLLAAITLPALANPAREAAINHFAAAAKAENPGFSGFSVARGEALYRTRFSGGEAETPACTACHTDNPASGGRTRAGKDIAPMAVSKSPDRYTDMAKIEKWFGRNCKSVLGRECTATEKGDFITFMSGK